MIIIIDAHNLYANSSHSEGMFLFVFYLFLIIVRALVTNNIRTNKLGGCFDFEFQL